MSFPYDLYTGLISTSPQQAVTVIDLQNPNTGQIQFARLINVASGDYVLNETGHFVGMNQIDQDVQLALTTQFRTATTPIGNTLLNIRLITPNLQNQVQSAVQTALANLINSQRISLGTVIIKNLGQGNVFLYVPWKNLITSQQQSINVPLGNP